MTTNSKLNVTYATVTPPAGTPVKQVSVKNSTGYFDLIVNKNANGKAIRISDIFGNSRVHVTLREVDALIEALKLVKKDGKKLSVDSISYAA